VLTINVESLSDTVLWVIDTHVPVNYYLMLHVFSLNVKPDRGLLRDLVIPECVLVIVGEFDKQAEWPDVLGVVLRWVKLRDLHKSQVCIPCAESAALRHHKEVSEIVRGREVLQEL